MNAFSKAKQIHHTNQLFVLLLYLGGSRYKPGICKSIQLSDTACPQIDLCTYDNECPENQKCCYHVCRKKVCYDPMTKREEEDMSTFEDLRLLSFTIS